ncbi:transcription repressor NadR [Proteiniborus sp. MB09-C3]|uniref:transcription repressor NadR n=1 Tax=Proteiniborus sp. MB09-C3 TaxID=3050072 RepID=UPI002556426B|nr:transcription repressor NadR [Proteiniborus sp. MB09-C3]WIV12614.1 transcription repressor NadR [Proteiniborus sp. MB09-C3]
MDSEKRREAIVQVLEGKDQPIKGAEFSKMFNVSRQVIVQDIAILRAKGEEIFATPQGYMIVTKSPKEKILKTIVCKHKGYDEIDDELKTIIDMGGKVIDVIVDHPIYGEIKSSLMLGSRIEIDEFVKSLKKEKAEPLSSLTEGVHIHTIEVPSMEIYEKILMKLEEKGYSINEK